MFCVSCCGTPELVTTTHNQVELHQHFGNESELKGRMNERTNERNIIKSKLHKRQTQNMPKSNTWTNRKQNQHNRHKK